MLKEFKEFAMRGSLLDLAIGIILGASFGRVVTSFVNDILMPPIGRLIGGLDIANLFIVLRGGPFRTVAAAKAAGVPTINYGLFLNAIIDFVVVAFVLFLLIRQVNRMQRKPEVTATTNPCPFCLSIIPLKAVRCPHCTSELAAA